MIITWTCHVCGEERNDEDIAVYSAPIPGLPGGQRNVRYCRDRVECLEGAKIMAIREPRNNHHNIYVEPKQKRSFWTRVAVKIGFLSPCCAAHITYEEGWDREYCSQCNKRIR